MSRAGWLIVDPKGAVRSGGPQLAHQRAVQRAVSLDEIYRHVQKMESRLSEELRELDNLVSYLERYVEFREHAIAEGRVAA